MIERVDVDDVRVVVEKTIRTVDVWWLLLADDPLLWTDDEILCRQSALEGS